MDPALRCRRVQAIRRKPCSCRRSRGSRVAGRLKTLVLRGSRQILAGFRPLVPLRRAPCSLPAATRCVHEIAVVSGRDSRRRRLEGQHLLAKHFNLVRRPRDGCRMAAMLDGRPDQGIDVMKAVAVGTRPVAVLVRWRALHVDGLAEGPEMAVTGFIAGLCMKRVRIDDKQQYGEEGHEPTHACHQYRCAFRQVH